MALPILRSCRSGLMPAKIIPGKIPTIWESLPTYAKAKRLQPSSLKRYESIIRTHFTHWKDSSVMVLGETAFAEHCQNFSRSNGNAVVDVGRGLISSLIKYLNAIYGLSITSPFDKLAAAGLMPEHAKPRGRKLQESDLPSWYKAVSTLPEKQRDYLMLIAFTGLRRDECKYIRGGDIDWDAGLLHLPKTKNGDPHSLSLTSRIREILMRRCAGLSSNDELFFGVSAEHISEMANRAGAPKFMLHDLRKLFATIGEKQRYSDTVLRRILNLWRPVKSLPCIWFKSSTKCLCPVQRWHISGYSTAQLVCWLTLNVKRYANNALKMLGTTSVTSLIPTPHRHSRSLIQSFVTMTNGFWQLSYTLMRRLIQRMRQRSWTRQKIASPAWLRIIRQSRVVELR
jgi:integrase